MIGFHVARLAGLAGLAAVTIAAPLAARPIAGVAVQPHRMHHHHRGTAAAAAAPAANLDGAGIPGYGYGRDPRPYGGFAVDPYGNGNYTYGAAGGFGGYPPGSDGAKELMNNQRYKCDFAPRTC